MLKKKICLFFQRGHGNEFSNLIGSLCGQEVPVSAHGHSNAYVSLCSFCLQSHSSTKAFYWTRKLKNKSFIFKTDFFITGLK